MVRHSEVDSVADDRLHASFDFFREPPGTVSSMRYVSSGVRVGLAALDEDESVTGKPFGAIFATDPAASKT